MLTVNTVTPPPTTISPRMVATRSSTSVNPRSCRASALRRAGTPSTLAQHPELGGDADAALHSTNPLVALIRVLLARVNCVVPYVGSSAGSVPGGWSQLSGESK